MLDDIGAAAEGSEHVDETEHLHFEMFVAHRELHHPLIKSGLAENRFRMAINQIKNLGAASLNLGLQETHVRIVNRASRLAKSAAAAHSPLGKQGHPPRILTISIDGGKLARWPTRTLRLFPNKDGIVSTFSTGSISHNGSCSLVMNNARPRSRCPRSCRKSAPPKRRSCLP